MYLAKYCNVFCCAKVSGKIFETLSRVLGFIGTLRKCAVYNSIMYLAKYCIYRNIPNTVFDHYCTVKYRIPYTNITVPGYLYGTVRYCTPVL